MYNKKPITDKIRTCLLPACLVIFEPTREDMKYCCRKHNELHWHLLHPRIYKNGLPQTQSAYEICGKDTARRDTPNTWLKYMKKNPDYYSALGISGVADLKMMFSRV